MENLDDREEDNPETPFNYGQDFHREPEVWEGEDPADLQ